MKFNLGINGKWIKRAWVTAAVALFLTFAWPGLAQVAGRQQLKGHVPKEAATAPLVGDMPGIEKLDLAISLPLRNQDQLDDLLKELYDPQSAQYHQFLTPDQFAERFAPTQADYDSVIQFAKSKGFTVTGTHANRALVEVSGNVNDIQKTFNVRLRYYRRPDGTQFHAPDAEPSVNFDVPLLHVAGLENYAVPRSFLRNMTTTAKKPGVFSGSSTAGYYIGNDFRHAYVPCTSLTGAGQNVASIQMDGFFQSDITSYESQAGIANNLPSVVLCGGSSGLPSTNFNQVEEASLDIEMQVSMAPAAHLYVYESPLSPAGWDSLFSTLAAPPAGTPLAKQISSSWHYIQLDFSVENSLAQMDAQGQAFFQASGDQNAYPADPLDNRDGIYMTLVGGTILTMNGTGASYASETTWYDNVTTGTGGGILSSENIPSYQNGMSVATNFGSLIERNAPDLSLVASNVLAFSNGGYQLPVEGTSCAAPLCAGLMALVNQQRSTNGLTPLGFANPAIYAIAKSAAYTTDFNDINDNSNNGSPFRYPAVTGYDLATGWGSPKCALIAALAPMATPTFTFTRTKTPTITPTPIFSFTPTPLAPTFTPTVLPPNCCQTPWSYANGNTIFSSDTQGLAYDPTSAMLYVGGLTSIQAVNPATGYIQSTLPFTYQTITEMTRGADGFLYVVDQSGNLYKVSLPDGNRTEMALFPSYATSVAVDNPTGNVYVGCFDSTVYQVTQTGQVNQLTLNGTPAPARSDVSGILYQAGVGSAAATLYVSDEHNKRMFRYLQSAPGSLTFNYSAIVSTGPIVFPHQVIADSSGSIYVSGATGYARYNKTFTTLSSNCTSAIVPDTTGLAVDNLGGVYLGAVQDGGALQKMKCLSPTPTPQPTYCCQALWSYARNNTTFSSDTQGLAYDPTSALLYVGGVSSIQGVNPSTSSVVSTLPAAYQTITQMTRGADGFLYVVDQSGNLYKVSLPDGNRSFMANFSAYGTSVAVDNLTGNIYVGCNDSNIYQVTQTGVPTQLILNGTPAPARSDVSGLLYQGGLGGAAATLYVSDEHNSRELRYVQAAAGSFTFNYSATVSTTVSFPHQVITDSSGGIYVCGATGYAKYNPAFSTLIRSCSSSLVPDTTGLTVDNHGGIYLGAVQDSGALAKMGCTVGFNAIQSESVVVIGGEATATPTPSPINTATPTPTPGQGVTLSGKVFQVAVVPNISLNGQPVKFEISLAQTASIHLSLYTVTGELVYESEVSGSEGMNEMNWGLVNHGSVPVASGLYVYVIQVEGSTENFLKTGKVVVLH